MKKTILPALFLLVLSIGLFGQTANEMSGSKLCSMRKSALPYTPLLPGAPESVPGHSFNVLKYTLDLDIRNCFISPYPKTFTGTEKVLFVVDSTLNFIKLNCDEASLQINSVGMAAASFSLTDNMLTLNLNQTYSPGDTVEVLVNYSHKNIDDGAFYVSNGFVFTDCEPEGARKWFPCWDKPSDKAKTDIRVKVPGNVKLGSNGALADSVITGDTIYYHWVSAHNVATYLTVMTGKVNYKLDIVYWENPNIPGNFTPIRFYYNAGEDPSAMENIIGPIDRKSVV
jgi:aminopeptidase N